jgi:hypothetical protein
MFLQHIISNSPQAQSAEEVYQRRLAEGMIMGQFPEQPMMAPSHDQTDPVAMLLMQLLHGMAPRTQTAGERNREWTETSAYTSDEDKALSELSESAAKYTKSRKRRK